MIILRCPTCMSETPVPNGTIEGSDNRTVVRKCDRCIKNEEPDAYVTVLETRAKLRGSMLVEIMHALRKTAIEMTKLADQIDRELDS